MASGLLSNGGQRITPDKEERKMRKHTRKGAVVALALLVATAAPVAALAGAGAGNDKGQNVQTRTQSGLRLQHQDRARLRDGSCLYGAQMRQGAMQKRGNTYGPGDGTGYGGVGPRDGTGYGAPSNR